MANRHINVDKTELVLTFLAGSSYTSANLSYDKITSIQFARCKEFRFFRFVPSEKIIIKVKKSENPIVYTMYKEKKYFEEYKKELAEFASRNRVSFFNDL